MSSFAASKTPSISINNSDDDLIEINYDKMIEEKEVIPDCVYDGIYCTEDKNNSDEKNWKDFSIFEKIIKYYSDNFWGFHKLCLNINENSKKKNNPFLIQIKVQANSSPSKGPVWKSFFK